MAPSGAEDNGNRRTRNRLAQRNYRKRQSEYKDRLAERIKALEADKSTKDQEQIDLSTRKSALESQLWDTMLAWEEANSAAKSGNENEALALLDRFCVE